MYTYVYTYIYIYIHIYIYIYIHTYIFLARGRSSLSSFPSGGPPSGDPRRALREPPARAPK